jgi:hypothetical protein
VTTTLVPLPPDTAPVYIVPKLSCISRLLKAVAVLVLFNVNEIVVPVVVVLKKLSVALAVGVGRGFGLIVKGVPVRNIPLGAVPNAIIKLPVVT